MCYSGWDAEKEKGYQAKTQEIQINYGDLVNNNTAILVH